MSLVLFGIGVEGVRLGVLNVKYRQASEPAYITLDLWLLSSWLVFVSFFMFLGHLRRYDCVCVTCVGVDDVCLCDVCVYVCVFSTYKRGVCIQVRLLYVW